MELTERMLIRLEHFGIGYVYVDDPRTDDIVFKDVISAETRARAVSEVRTHFRKMMDDGCRKLSVSNIQLGKAFRSIVDLIIDELGGNTDAMAMLLNLDASDHYLFQHSVNVCIYSTILGQAHGYSREELSMLGLGSLLHDIGKTKIPNEVLQKPGKLTAEEYDIVKRHAEIGFKMLKDVPNIPLVSAHIAFQHHERINGSGYPRGILGGEMQEFSKWVSIADSYDAMTSNRVYRSAMLPHEAMEIIYTGAGTLYDVEKIRLFRDKIAIYPIGIVVGLSTGETGVVVDINSAFPQRPIVRILSDLDGRPLKAPYEVDLSKKLNINVSMVSYSNVNVPV